MPPILLRLNHHNALSAADRASSVPWGQKTTGYIPLDAVQRRFALLNRRREKLAGAPHLTLTAQPASSQVKVRPVSFCLSGGAVHSRFVKHYNEFPVPCQYGICISAPKTCIFYPVKTCQLSTFCQQGRRGVRPGGLFAVRQIYFRKAVRARPPPRTPPPRG